MRNFLKQFAEDNSYVFDYGTKAFQNLRNSDSKEVHVFVDPIREKDNLEDGYIVSKSYEGSLFMGIPSNLSESYDFRYENYIEPIKQIHYPRLKDAFKCSEFELQAIGAIEIVNSRELNLNCDGLLITYSALRYEQ